MLSPYTRFDPETGFFIPIDKQAAEEENQDSTMALDQNEQQSNTMQVEESPVSIRSTNQSLLMLGGMVFLLAGMILGFRKYQHNV